MHLQAGSRFWHLSCPWEELSEGSAHSVQVTNSGFQDLQRQVVWLCKKPDWLTWSHSDFQYSTRTLKKTLLMNIYPRKKMRPLWFVPVSSFTEDFFQLPWRSKAHFWSFPISPQQFFSNIAHIYYKLIFKNSWYSKWKLIDMIAYDQMHSHKATQPCNTWDYAMVACMCSIWFTQYKASLLSTKSLYWCSADTSLIYFVINLLTKWTQTFFCFTAAH